MTQEEKIEQALALASGGMSQREIATVLDCSQSTVNGYLNRPLHRKPYPFAPSTKTRLNLSLASGTIIVASDAHYWPSCGPTTAHRGLVEMVSILQPSIVIANGDMLDGARVSKHAAIGWEKRPTVFQELEECQLRLGEVAEAAGDARLVWTLGNHDMRFETRLSHVAPEYENIKGMHLKDHFPNWTPCWSCWINGSTVIKHRFKGGNHASYNNTITSGLTMVTGHTHRLCYRSVSDYNGTRYGVECGSLAEPYSEPFIDYTEDNAVDWQSGFMVLTFHKHQLLPPEPAYVVGDGKLAFRGSIFDV